MVLPEMNVSLSNPGVMEFSLALLSADSSSLSKQLVSSTKSSIRRGIYIYLAKPTGQNRPVLRPHLEQSELQKNCKVASAELNSLSTSMNDIRNILGSAAICPPYPSHSYLLTCSHSLKLTRTPVPVCSQQTLSASAPAVRTRYYLVRPQIQNSISPSGVPWALWSAHRAAADPCQPPTCRQGPRAGGHASRALSQPSKASTMPRHYARSMTTVNQNLKLQPP